MRHLNSDCHVNTSNTLFYGISAIVNGKTAYYLACPETPSTKSMTRFNLSTGRYSTPFNSRYARYIQERTVDGKDPHVNAQNKSNQEIKHGTYGALLFHPKWKARRVEILGRDNNSCVICAKTEKLEVHHRQYHMIKATGEFKPPWDYPDYLLITLCVKCHQRGHAKYKVPTIYI